MKIYPVINLSDIIGLVVFVVIGLFLGIGVLVVKIQEWRKKRKSAK